LLGFEKEIIYRTKSSISKDDKSTGKLIQRTQKDADELNEFSRQLFNLLKDNYRAAELASFVSIIPSNSIKKKKYDVASEKIMPGKSSVAISKYLDDAMKRAKNIKQRTQMLLKSIVNLRSRTKQNIKDREDESEWMNAVKQNI
jgi:hypothetical protein